MGIVPVFIVPLGVGDRDLPRGVRGQHERGGTALIELNIQNLAAVPSIVYGILGLAFFVRGPLDLGQRGARRAALTLALLVLPMVIIASREALRAVPPSIREGSLALGATQWQTIWRQVLPAAMPGIADRRDPRAVARDRRDGAADPGRRARVHHASTPSGLDIAFTALPIQIFNWISRAPTTSTTSSRWRPRRSSCCS